MPLEKMCSGRILEPLAANAKSGNKNLPIRGPYVPPHLRRPVTAASTIVASSKHTKSVTNPEENQSSGSDTKQFVPPHLRLYHQGQQNEADSPFRSCKSSTYGGIQSGDLKQAVVLPTPSNDRVCSPKSEKEEHSQEYLPPHMRRHATHDKHHEQKLPTAVIAKASGPTVVRDHESPSRLTVPDDNSTPPKPFSAGISEHHKDGVDALQLVPGLPSVQKSKSLLLKEHLDQFMPESLRHVPKPVYLSEVRAKQGIPLAENALQYTVPAHKQGVVYERIKVFESNPVASLKMHLVSDEPLAHFIRAVNEYYGRSAVTDLAPFQLALAAEEPAIQAGHWRWYNQEIKSVASETKPQLEDFTNYGLTRCDGSFVPAALEWDLRPQFGRHERHRMMRMESWVHERMNEALRRPFHLDTSASGFRSGILPISGTLEEYQDIPEECSEPMLYGPFDWNYFLCIRHPEPYTNVESRLIQSAQSSILKFHRHLIVEKATRKQERERERQRQLAVVPDPVATRRRIPIKHAPKAKIYIRPAERNDLAQIARIFNHYVLRTIVTPECEETSASGWAARMESIQGQSLPFLVAAIKGSRYKSIAKSHRELFHGRRGRNEESSPKIDEKIVGFGMAQEFGGTNLPALKGAVELCLFVDKAWIQQGIGKTLLDRMMPALDPHYASRAATRFLTEDKPYYESGGRREVRKVCITLYFSYSDDRDFLWQKDYLEMQWDFDHCATYPTICEKFGKG
jgi:L-amino acid N-acyltransferase YncA